MAGISDLGPDFQKVLKFLSGSSKANWTLGRSSLSGRGLFAAEPIKSGDLILSNSPLVIGPRADCTSKYFCTICYEIRDSCFRCDKCQLLVCSNECKESKIHNVECSFITEKWKQKPKLENHTDALTKNLIHLHFLLLTEEQKSILNIFQRSKTKNSTEELQELLNKYTVPQEHVELIDIVNSVLKINSFRIGHEENKIQLRGLYPLSALLNHSCVPNTRNIFEKDYTMKIYAAKDIKAGEEILTCYTGLLWSTPARRMQLYKMKGFWCFCKRCGDRSEMGTNLASLKCPNRECSGMLLPETPVDPRTDWNCDNCNTKISANHVGTIQSVLGSLIGTLNLDDEIQLESSVLERLSSFVPYSSHIFVDLRLRLSLKIGFVKGLKIKGRLNRVLILLYTNICKTNKNNFYRKMLLFIANS